MLRTDTGPTTMLKSPVVFHLRTPVYAHVHMRTCIHIGTFAHTCKLAQSLIQLRLRTHMHTCPFTIKIMDSCSRVFMKQKLSGRIHARSCAHACIQIRANAHFSLSLPPKKTTTKTPAKHMGWRENECVSWTCVIVQVTSVWATCPSSFPSSCRRLRTSPRGSTCCCTPSKR